MITETGVCVIELLQEADLVKFANYTPPASRAYEAAGEVRTLVEATRLAYEAASPQQRNFPTPGSGRVSDLSFGSPWLLFLLPAVLVLAALPYWWKGRMGPAGMRYADTNLVSGSARSLRLRVMPFVPVLRFLALALVIVAAARPQVADAREVIRGEGVDIAIALDISGSMGQTDFAPHRLGAAKQIIAEFVEERQYDRIGLVVFSQEAFIQSPPTLDHDVLLRLLADVHLADQLGIEDGTAIGSGMATAANMLKESDSESRLVTLLTDGVNNAGQLDPLTVATAAEALDIKLYTIGVGTSQPSAAEAGGAGESPLDEETLREIAAITKAKYYRATDTEGLRDIYAEINALEQSEVEVLVFTRYQELLAWFLAPGLALLLLEVLLSRTVFRRIP